nr:hypothetical protein [Kribbella sp. VKM Ac-2568]
MSVVPMVNAELVELPEELGVAVGDAGDSGADAFIDGVESELVVVRERAVRAGDGVAVGVVVGFAEAAGQAVESSGPH